MALDLPFAMAPMQHSGLAREHFIPSFDPCEHTMLHVRPLSRLLFSLHSRKVDGRLIKRTLLQYGLTPRSEIANKDYHPLPHFAHLTRLKNVVANFNSNEPLFVYLRRLRKDRLDEPTAVRMKRGHGSSCAFVLLLLGLSSLFTLTDFCVVLLTKFAFRQQVRSIPSGVPTSRRSLTTASAMGRASSRRTSRRRLEACWPSLRASGGRLGVGSRARCRRRLGCKDVE